MKICHISNRLGQLLFVLIMLVFAVPLGYTQTYKTLLDSTKTLLKRSEKEIAPTDTLKLLGEIERKREEIRHYREKTRDSTPRYYCC
jgi:hypothetical protein